MLKKFNDHNLLEAVNLFISGDSLHSDAKTKKTEIQNLNAQQF